MNFEGRETASFTNYGTGESNANIDIRSAVSRCDLPSNIRIGLDLFEMGGEQEDRSRRTTGLRVRQKGELMTRNNNRTTHSYGG